MSSERDPLIPRTASPEPAENKKFTKVGPLEISPTTRYGILAGIWVGTFLSVCTFLSSVYRTSNAENIFVVLVFE